MISIIMEISNFQERVGFVGDRISALKQAFFTGRIDQRTFAQRLRYWNAVKAGVPGSPQKVMSGEAPDINTIKNSSSYF